MTTYTATAVDFIQWRAKARQLLRAQVAPSAVSWADAAQASLFSGATDDLPVSHADAANTVTISKELISMLEVAACFRSSSQADVWALMYRLVWRYAFEGRALLHLQTDPDVKRLRAMCQSVRRDMHKMKAFVRFRRVAYSPPSLEVAEAVATYSSQTEESVPLDSDSIYIAWFEPEHRIVKALASFFRGRFSGMRWSILTLDDCVHWNGEQLRFSEGVAVPPATNDEMESLWSTYYCNIFNPARLKEKAMQSEMPKKYWQHLPESIHISDLCRSASAKTISMLQHSLTDPNRLRKKSQALKQAQDLLRNK